MKKILLPLPNGVEEMEAVTIVDILRRAGLKTTMAGLHSADTPIIASREVRLMPDAAWDNLNQAEYDALILPGGGDGTTALAADRRILEAVRHFADSGKLLGAICAAPLVLQAAGVIAGRKITSYPGIADRLTGCEWINQSVVTDGNLVTGQGPAAAIEFALTLTQILAGADTASSVAREMGCRPPE